MEDEMATYTCKTAAHPTIVANVADVVNIGACPSVTVTAPTAGDAYVCLGDEGVAAAVPTLLGTDCYVVRAGTAKTFDCRDVNQGQLVTQVGIICGSGGLYHVEAG